MTLWVIIMWTTLALTGAALLFVSNRVCQFGFMQRIFSERPKVRKAFGVVLVFGIFGIIGIYLHFMNAVICAIYFAMIWALCDLVFFVIAQIRKRPFKKYYSGFVAVILSIIALFCGWYLAHNVWQTDYTILTTKDVNPLKIALFADAHVGTTFHAKEFSEHMAKIQAQNPDMLIISGDFVDDDTSKEDMVEACRILGTLKMKYGIYFVFGNHDVGYYSPLRRGYSAHELVAELEKNGVKVLRDEAVLVDDMYYIIGRHDFSVERERRGRRKTMAQWKDELEQSKYMIVADHQPADYQNQEKSGVDLVLSGHTHGGQLFPFNYVGKLIGANDKIYGHEKRNATNFIVTSGISDWAIKFKTGTKSEFVIINILKNS